MSQPREDNAVATLKMRPQFVVTQEPGVNAFHTRSEDYQSGWITSRDHQGFFFSLHGSLGGAAKVAIHRLRKRFRELVKAEIAQTVDDAAQVQDELRYLLEVLSQP